MAGTNNLGTLSITIEASAQRLIEEFAKVQTAITNLQKDLDRLATPLATLKRNMTPAATGVSELKEAFRGFSIPAKTITGIEKFAAALPQLLPLLKQLSRIKLGNMSGITELATAMGTLNKNTSSTLARRLEAIATAMLNVKTNMRGAKTLINNVAQAFNALQTSVGAAGGNRNNLNTALNNLSSNMSGTAAPARRHAQSMSLVKASVDDTALAHNNLIHALTGLSIPFGQMFGRIALINTIWKTWNLTLNQAREGIRNLIETDQALRNVQAITLTTTKEFEQILKSLTITMNQSKFTSAELADIYVQLGQAGLSGTEATQAFTSVVQLATATLTPLADTVQILTTVLRAYNIDASKTDIITNELVSATNKSKLSIEGLNTSLNYVGTAAYNANVSLEDTLSSLAVLADSGVKASTQGTGLRQVFSTLLAPTARFKERIYQLGLNMTQLNPITNSYTDVLLRLKNAGFTASDAFATLELRTASTFAKLVENAELIKYQSDSISSSRAALAAYLTQSQGLDFQVKVLKNSFNSLFIENEGFSNSMRNGILVLQGAISSIKELLETIRGFKPFFDYASPLLTKFVEGWILYRTIAYSSAKASITLFNVLNSFGTGGVLSKAIWNIYWGFKLWTSEIGLIISRLGGLGGTFLTLGTMVNSTKLRMAFTGLGMFITNTFSGATLAIGAVIGTTIGAMLAVIATLTAAIYGLKKVYDELTKRSVESFVEIRDNLRELQTQQENLAKDVVDQKPGAVYDLLANLKESYKYIKDNLDTIGRSVEEESAEYVKQNQALEEKRIKLKSVEESISTQLSLGTETLAQQTQLTEYLKTAGNLLGVSNLGAEDAIIRIKTELIKLDGNQQAVTRRFKEMKEIIQAMLPIIAAENAAEGTSVTRKQELEILGGKVNTVLQYINATLLQGVTSQAAYAAAMEEVRTEWGMFLAEAKNKTPKELEDAGKSVSGMLEDRRDELKRVREEITPLLKEVDASKAELAKQLGKEEVLPFLEGNIDNLDKALLQLNILDKAGVNVQKIRENYAKLVDLQKQAGTLEGEITQYIATQTKLNDEQLESQNRADKNLQNELAGIKSVSQANEMALDKKLSGMERVREELVKQQKDTPDPAERTRIETELARLTLQMEDLKIVKINERISAETTSLNKMRERLKTVKPDAEASAKLEVDIAEKLLEIERAKNELENASLERQGRINDYAREHKEIISRELQANIKDINAQIAVENTARGDEEEKLALLKREHDLKLKMADTEVERIALNKELKDAEIATAQSAIIHEEKVIQLAQQAIDKANLRRGLNEESRIAAENEIEAAKRTQTEAQKEIENQRLRMKEAGYTEEVARLKEVDITREKIVKTANEEIKAADKLLTQELKQAAILSSILDIKKARVVSTKEENDLAREQYALDKATAERIIEVNNKKLILAEQNLEIRRKELDDKKNSQYEDQVAAASAVEGAEGTVDAIKEIIEAQQTKLKLLDLEYEATAKINDVWREMAKTINDDFAQGITDVMFSGGKVKDVLKSLKKDITDGFKNAFKESIKAKIPLLDKPFKGNILNLGEFVQNNLGTAFQNVASFAGNLFGMFGGGGNGSQGGVGGLFGGILNGIGAIGKGIGSMFGWSQAGGAGGSGGGAGGLMGTIGSMFGGSGGGSNAMSYMGTAANLGSKAMGGSGYSLVGSGLSSMGSLWGSLGSTIDWGSMSMGGFLSGLAGGVGGYGLGPGLAGSLVSTGAIGAGGIGGGVDIAVGGMSAASAATASGAGGAGAAAGGAGSAGAAAGGAGGTGAAGAVGAAAVLGAVLAAAALIAAIVMIIMSFLMKPDYFKMFFKAYKKGVGSAFVGAGGEPLGISKDGGGGVLGRYGIGGMTPTNTGRFTATGQGTAAGGINTHERQMALEEALYLSNPNNTRQRIEDISDAMAAYGVVLASGIKRSKAFEYAQKAVNATLASMVAVGYDLSKLDMESFYGQLARQMGSFKSAVEEFNKTIKKYNDKKKSLDMEFVKDTIRGLTLIFWKEFPAGVDAASHAIRVFREKGTLDIEALRSSIEETMSKVADAIKKITEEPIKFILETGSLQKGLDVMGKAVDSFIKDFFTESILTTISSAVVKEGFLTPVIDQVQFLQEALYKGEITNAEYGDSLRKLFQENLLPNMQVFKDIMKDTFGILSSTLGFPLDMLPSFFKTKPGEDQPANELGYGLTFENDRGIRPKTFTTSYLAFSDVAANIRKLKETSNNLGLAPADWGTKDFVDKEAAQPILDTYMATVLAGIMAMSVERGINMTTGDIELDRLKKDAYEWLFHNKSYTDVYNKKSILYPGIELHIRSYRRITKKGRRPLGASYWFTGNIGGTAIDPQADSQELSFADTESALSLASGGALKKTQYLNDFLTESGVSVEQFTAAANRLFGGRVGRDGQPINVDIGRLTADQITQILNLEEFDGVLAEAKAQLLERIAALGGDVTTALQNLAKEISSAAEFAAVFSAVKQAIEEGFMTADIGETIIAQGLQALKEELPKAIDLEEIYRKALGADGKLNIDLFTRLLTIETTSFTQFVEGIKSAVTTAFTSKNVSAGIDAFTKAVKKSLGDSILEALMESFTNEIFISGIFGPFFDTLDTMMLGYKKGEVALQDILAFIGGALPGLGDTVDAASAALAPLLQQIYDLFADAGFLDAYGDAISSQAKVVQDQLTVAQRWEEIAKSIRDSKNSILFGQGTPQNIRASLFNAQQDLNVKLARYRKETDVGRKQTAASDVITAVNTLFGLATNAGEQLPEYQRTAPGFQTLSHNLLGVLTEIENTAVQGASQVDVLLKQLELLQQIADNTAKAVTPATPETPQTAIVDRRVNLQADPQGLGMAPAVTTDVLTDILDRLRSLVENTAFITVLEKFTQFIEYLTRPESLSGSLMGGTINYYGNIVVNINGTTGDLSLDQVSRAVEGAIIRSVRTGRVGAELRLINQSRG